ncbi:alkaline phosphatase family protein [Salinicola sp. LHM]|uniref:alkaline phosphatase family protein n=1 Tax=Salinicola sp. LHM TaxID=3065298 RepID=UPI002ACE2BBF|nr:alkaline phosphatase family protein [Salinicola sp. LHM]WQH33219.1 alkaline phosphatase family protein [Salinicola sp. LHM]
MSQNRKILLLGVDGLIPELVERFCAEGVLPNIQRLRDEGGSTRLLPYISTWGDTNFVTFLTGQAPGTSWVGQRLPPSGTQHLLELMSAAGQRAALVHFPESLKPTGPEDLCFAPFWSGSGPAPMELAPACLHSTRLDRWEATPQTEALGWPPTGTLAHHQKHNRFAIERAGDGFVALIPAHRGEPVPVTLSPNGERLQLTLADGEASLSVGEWSEWLPLELEGKRTAIRFKLLDFDAASGRIDLLQSQVTAPAPASGQPEVAQRLIERHGPFISKWAVSADPDTRYFETSFEEGRYQLEWLVDSALTLLNEEGFQLFATVFRLNDETHHTCLAQCDPESKFYAADDAARYLEVIRRSYRVLDDAVGRALDGCDDDTVVVLASDHGDVPNSHLCDIHRRLAEFDLCTIDGEGKPDVAASQAFLKDERGGLEIFVNRNLVPTAEIERVQTRILKALTTWYVETTSGERNVVALALKKQDASPLGYWGELMGDVLFAYAPGFVWGTNERGDTVAELVTPGANHGPQVPTASTAFASNHGVAFFHGLGIRGGVELPFDTARGIQRMDSAGATFARLLGLPTDSLDGKPLTTLLDPA